MDPLRSSAPTLVQASSSASSSGTKVQVQTRQVNESLFELHKPSGTLQIQVLFFHGLQFQDSSDIHLSTWECGDGSCWPQTWLVEEFPRAHILSVSYNGGIKRDSPGVLDMYRVGENLTSDLLDFHIGQMEDCPIVMVGHSFGGLVIKQLFRHAHDKLHSSRDGFEKDRLRKFLGSIRGILYYATPHRGSQVVEKMAKTEANPLLEYFQTLSTGAARLNSTFDQISGQYGKLDIFGLGEGRKTKLSRFRDDIMVPEASTRVENFYTVSEADHYSICQPKSKTSAGFSKLRTFLGPIVTVAEEVANNHKLAKIHESHGADNLQYLPESIVGIEIPMQAVIDKLDKAAKVGLVGMGGLGKSTLAKAIFNKLAVQFDRFDYSCFVMEVKKIEGDMEKVKKEVWELMHQHGKKVGKEKSWSSLTGKRLLLVLDDISNECHLDLLSSIVYDRSPESRVIVTTRDQKLLRTFDDVYNLSVLKDGVAKELFLSYAFGNQKGPSLKLEDLTDKIVKKCDGLPLTLEVMGKCLYKQGDEEDWKQILHALENASDVSDLNEKVWAKLRVSYDRLSAIEKKIFLDVTTFFSGNENWTLRDAKAAWRMAYDTETERIFWKQLVDLSLVYDVDEDETVKVHEQLQSLGRKIASDQCRVWDKPVGLKLLQRTNELEDQVIYSLRLDGESDSNDQEIHIASSALQRLKELHYLDTGDGIIIDGAPRCDPIPTKLILLNSGVLELSQVLVHSSLTERLVGLKLELLEPPKLAASPIERLAELLVFLCAKKKKKQRLVEEIWQFSQLEVLYMRHCQCHRLPEKFGQLVKLRHLVLEGFGNLYTLPNSFGQLKVLSHLEVNECQKLRSLPDSFGELSSLESLIFQECDELDQLPTSFGHLKALRHLQLIWCHKLSSLPDSFGELSSLERLQFLKCDELDNLPTSFRHLKALRHLQLQRCHKLLSLPDSFGELSSLERLEFWDCGELNKLPTSFGHLKALRHLELMRCHKLSSLPDSFGELSSLERLLFRNCDELDTLPTSFGHLKALRHLELQGCHKLRSLPDSFGELSSLERLEFCDCGELNKLPTSLGHLKALRHLQLNYCCKLLSLPDSFGELSSLERLEFWDFGELDKLPTSFGHLKALRHLELNECHKLSSLPDSFGELSSLERLQFYECGELDKLPTSFGLLKALRHLTLHECHKLSSLPDSFGELSSLERLQFWMCGELDKLPTSFGHLKALRHLELHWCHKLSSLPDSFGELSSLERLEFDECGELDKLPTSFGHLKALRHLELKRCHKLRSLPDAFGELSSLNDLDVSNCDELDNLPESFRKLKALRHLKIKNCFKIQSLPESFGELPALEYLKLAGDEKLHTLPNGLDYLQFRRVKQYEDRGPTLIVTSEAP